MHIYHCKIVLVLRDRRRRRLIGRLRRQERLLFRVAGNDRRKRAREILAVAVNFIEFFPNDARFVKVTSVRGEQVERAINLRHHHHHPDNSFHLSKDRNTLKMVEK